MTEIKADFIQIGVGTFIHPTAIIRGVSGNATRIVIGDNCYIGADVQIIIDDFEMGDYGKIQHHTNIHGYKPCKIGHNAWIGQYSIIDSIGGVSIGNNCGIGAHSQLWSHIKFGDTLEGCRFLSEKLLSIEDDVWFTGHCIVSPIHAASKSMAMVGSVITKDMEFNQIYAGSPAKSISDKIGNQFEEVDPEEKLQRMSRYLIDSGLDISKIRVVRSKEEVDFEDLEHSWFSVSDRKYTKRGTETEVSFMKFLLPEKGKFVPF
jgi:acetyltransferase-like isoleucine patch superfamily enzyme